MEKISPPDWNSCYFSRQGLKAFISLGAEWSGGAVQEFYYINLCDEEWATIFQERHDSIDDACQKLNERYGHMELVDQRQSTQEAGGCSSCQAH
jgi:hypothetical protein